MRAKVIALAIEHNITNCPECGRWLDYQHSKRPNSPEADEIVPYSLRGYTSTDPCDWQVLCMTCNQSKGDRARPARARGTEPVTSQDW